MNNQPGGVPVFVDRTGRRRRVAVIAGTALGLGLLASLGLVFAGLFTDSTVRVPGWSEQKRQPPIEVGLDGIGPRTSPSARPTASPRPAAPAQSATATASPVQPSASRPPARPSARPSPPGQGDEHRNTARPSKSPGKPR